MHFDQLHYFLAVARERKFSTAAEDTYVSQSALSKQIKSLEQELGVELFRRSAGGATLTPAGEVFQGFATKVYRDYENVLTQLDQYRDSGPLHIRMGALPLVSDYGLYADLADFQVNNMSIQIDFCERNQGEILRRMELHRLDLAILRTDLLSTEQYEWIDLVKDEIVIVCPIRHRLARRDTVPYEELREEKFVLLVPESAVTATFVSKCKETGFFPNVVFTHTRHEPLLAAVGKNAGITALPRGLTRRISRVPPQVLLRCVALEEPLYTNVGLTRRLDHKLTPWAENLWDYFKQLHPVPVGPEDISGAENRAPSE